MLWFWIVLGILLLSATIPAFLIAPGRITKTVEKTALSFRGRNYAHRGLHTQNQSVPENSLAAFAAARDAGYGVELDIQLSKDGHIVVFHDDYLSRVCGVDRRVDQLTWTQLQELTLFDTHERIPLFETALKTLGNVPVIVELKSAGNKNALLCSSALNILTEHGLLWCVESFDPRIVAWFRKHAPTVLRGQLSCPQKQFDKASPTKGFALGNLLSNVLSRPHFIAYKACAHLPLSVQLCYALGAIRAVWTVREDMSPSHYEKENDLVIFEYYEPLPYYLP